MGILRYAGRSVALDDALLAHLQVVIAARFRRGEAFDLTWQDGSGPRRVPDSLRLDPGTPVALAFTAPPAAVDERWLRRLDVAPGIVVLVDADGAPIVLGAPPPRRSVVAALLARLRRTLPDDVRPRP